LAKRLRLPCRRAVAYAEERGHKNSATEHLLLALLDDPDAQKVLLALGVDTEGLRSEVTEFLDHDLAEAVDGLALPQPTAGFQRTIQRAVVRSKAYAYSVDGANVLVALFSERGSHATNFLADRGLTRRDVVHAVVYGRVRRGPEPASIQEILESVRPQTGLTFEMQTAKESMTLEDAQEILEVIRIDVNWAWRVSEAIARFINRDTASLWVSETMDELIRLAGGRENVGAQDIHLSMPEFDPVDPTILARPVIIFVDAQCYDQVQAKVVMKAASSTQLVAARMWSLRTWGRGRSSDELKEAKVELLQEIVRQMKCSDAQQRQMVETLVRGFLNAPNGAHARGEAVVLSIPHLL
jgi:hypothetical protein